MLENNVQNVHCSETDDRAEAEGQARAGAQTRTLYGMHHGKMIICFKW